MYRYAIVIAILGTLFHPYSTDYYFAAGGSDISGNGTSGNPYQSITKLNTLTLVAGDRVLFNGNDTFPGQITQPGNGSTGNPVTYTSYGTGKAVISGFQNLGIGAWTSLGSNKWQASINSGVYMDVLMMNDDLVPMGRTPDAGSYFNMDSHTNSTGGGTPDPSISPLTGATVVSTGLSGAASSYVGGIMVLRVNAYNTDRFPITAGSSNTLTYSSTNGNINGTMDNGNKFFIQNLLSTVTAQNEWYYDPVGHTVTMYSSTNPQTFGIKVGKYDYAMNYFQSGTHSHDVKFDNLKFQGQDSIGLMFLGVENITVTNCEFKHVGTDAVSFGDAPYGNYVCYNMIVDNNKFRRIGNTAIVMRRSSLIRVRENDIDTAGIYEGLGLGNNQQHNGIMIENPEGQLGAFNDSIVVYHNITKHTGYCGIRWTGQKATVSYNYVQTYGMLQSDGGGLYTSRNGGDSGAVYRDIHHNIVLTSVGNNNSMSNNTNGGMPGIYNDDESVNIHEHHNTIIDGTRYGIFLHNNRNINLEYNNIFNGGDAAFAPIKDGLNPWYSTRGLDIQHNTVYTSSGMYSEYQSITIACCSAAGDLSNYGTINNNTYARSSGTTWFHYYNGGGSDGTYSSLSSWTGAYGKDVNSTIQTVISDSMQIFYNATLSSAVVSFSGLTYRDMAGNNYSDQLTLAAFESIIVRKVTYISSGGGGTPGSTFIIQRAKGVRKKGIKAN